jgi:hypothetical protein
MARQGELFGRSPLGQPGPIGAQGLPLLAHQLQQWQGRLARHQAPLFAKPQAGSEQATLFASSDATPEQPAAPFNPLSLQPQPLSFWRWPAAPQHGAALYFVADRPPALGEALHKANLGCQLSIRFWLDVPTAIGPRRALEQALIRLWLPPFNKETRNRWATPFQADQA